MKYYINILLYPVVKVIAVLVLYPVVKVIAVLYSSFRLHGRYLI